MINLQVSIEMNGVQTKVGTISGLTADQAVFSYSREYLESAGCVPVSVSLPLRREAFSVPQTRCFFDGLLPEGFTRHSVIQWAHAAANDYLSILQALGEECIGAIQILPEGTPAPPPLYEKLSMDQVQALAREGTSKSAEIVTKTHLSLTGASGKAGLYYHPETDTWYLPCGSAPSTHILKQSHIRFRHIIANEQLALLTAEKLGLNVSGSFIVNTGTGKEDEVLFASRRFDRRFPDSPHMVQGLPLPLRLHQEDFAQALGIPSAEKYEPAEKHFLKDMFRLLRNVSADPVADQLALWDIIVFDFLIGNTDNHLKNYSLLYAPDLKSIRLAPAYDIVSTVVYPQSTREMSFHIGNERTIGSVSRESFRQAARDAALGTTLALSRFDRLAGRFQEALALAAAQLADEGYSEAEKLHEKVLKYGGYRNL